MSDRARSSLFFVPVLCVVGGIVIRQAMPALDALITDIDPRLTATVDSARTVPTTVAGAALTFADIAFSVSLLLISLEPVLASRRARHVPRPVRERVTGLVIGTFTYCLVVLRAVRSSLENGGEAVVPSVSILLAVVLGIVSILSIVAFINHPAQSMDVSQICDVAPTRCWAAASRPWPEPEPDSPPDDDREQPLDLPEGAVAVCFAEYGWVQKVVHEQRLAALPSRSRVRLDTFAGQYAIQKTPGDRRYRD